MASTAALPATNQLLNPQQFATAAANAAQGYAGRLQRNATNAAASANANSQSQIVTPFGDPASPANTRGVLWDTTQDAAVGDLDKQIANAQKYITAGSNQFSPQQLQDLQAKRTQANAARWQSATLTGSPARDQIRAALADGTLTYQDLGNIDISALNGDDAALSGQITQLLAAKVAPPPATPPAGPGTPDPTQAQAQQATSDVLPQTMKLLDKQNAGLKTFDEGALATQNRLGSTASTLGRKIGGADAGALANQASTTNQANQSAARKNLQQDNYNELNSFINDTVSKDITGKMDMATANSAKGAQIQGQAMDSLFDEIKKSVSSTDEGAQNQIAQLEASIAKFKNAQGNEAEQNAERTQIIALATGLLGAGLGAMAAGPFGSAVGNAAGQALGTAAGKAL